MIGTTEHRLTLEDGGGNLLLPASSDEVTSIIFCKGDYDDGNAPLSCMRPTPSSLCSRWHG